MEPKKMGIAARSADTNWLVAQLLLIAVGETITYAALSAGLRRDVQGEARGVLQSARHIVEREERRLFDVIVDVGLKRADDLTVTRMSQRDGKHIARTSRRSLRRLATCADRANLGTDDRAQYDLTSATMGMVAHVTRPQTQKKLAAKVTPSMPTTSMLEALRESI